MKLVKVEPTRSLSSDPSIGISRLGTFVFNKSATKNLNLPGKTINFYYDDARPSDWYLEVLTKNAGSLSLHPKNKDYVSCSCRSISKMIKKQANNSTEKGLKALIGKPIEKTGMTLYPLLIKKGNETYHTK